MNKDYHPCPKCQGNNHKCDICNGWGRTVTIELPYYVIKQLRKDYQDYKQKMTFEKYITERLTKMVYGF